MFKRILILPGFFLLLAITSFYSKAVKYEHELLNENDGIPSSIIFSIVQDKDGFLWIGTGYDGIVRYDGKNFVRFVHDPSDIQSLPHNNSGNLFIDSDNQIWIGSWGGGLLKFDTKAETFVQHIFSPENDTSIASNNVQSLFEDTKGNLWVGKYSTGLSSFDSETQGFTRYSKLDGKLNPSANERVWDIEQTDDDLLWVATDFGLIQLNTQTLAQKHHMLQPSSMLSNRYRVRQIMKGNTDNLFLGTQNGVVRFDLSSETFTNLKAQGVEELGPIYSILKTSFGEYWVSSDHGVFSFKEGSKQLKKVPLNFDDRCSQSLFQDRQGTIWLSCEGMGLYQITRRSTFNSAQNIELKSAFSLAQSTDNTILVGTSQYGLLRWVQENDEFISLSKSDDENTIPAITLITQSSAGDIWFGDSERLFKIDDFGLQSEITPSEPLSAMFTNITDMDTDRFGHLWLVTTQGLFVINKDNSHIKYFSMDTISEGKLSQSISSRVFKDSNSKMWVSFGNMIYSYDEQTRRFSELLDENIVYEESGVQNFIYSMHIDAKNRMWVGNKRGFFLVDINTGKRELISDFFNERENQGIRFISEDAKGYIWLVTAIGVSRFDPETQQLRHFDQRDGLPGSRYFYRPTVRKSDGWIFLSSRDGLFYFNPLDVKDYRSTEPTKLTNFEVLGSGQRFNIAQAEQNGVFLEYDQTNVKFEFATLDLLNARQIQYSYMLEGFDQEWIENSNSTSATYTNLNGGRYTFKVKSKVKQNLWYENQLAVDVKIATPIWERKWMFVVYACTVLIFILVYIKRQKQAVILLEKQVAEKTADIALESSKLASANRIKTQFLANMSHEIRTPLTTVIGQAEAIICRDVDPKNIYKEVEIIHDSGLYLLALLNDILDLTKIEENKFELEYSSQDLHILLNNINTMFSMQAQVKGLSFVLTKRLPQPFVVRIDGLRLKQILINLLSNALKFTIQGSVKLNVELTEEQLIFDIEDTGIGIRDEQIQQIFGSFTQGDSSIRRRFGGSGLGLHLSNQLAHLMGGKISVVSELDKGSVFSFCMPIAVSSGGVELPHGTLNFDTVSSKPLFDGKILLAEDHDDNRRLLSRLLTKLGLTVYAARDGFEATQLYQEHNPEVVLMDIQMPRMDGLQAYKELRKLGCDKPIIALTANAMQNEVEAYFELGFDGYIQKPVDRHLLISTIATFFGTKQDNSMNRASSMLGNVDMSDLVIQFKDSLHREISAFKESAEVSDIDAIEAQAHKLSGAAQLFGFSDLSKIARDLETFIKSNPDDSESITQKLDNLIVELSKHSS